MVDFVYHSSTEGFNLFKTIIEQLYNLKLLLKEAKNDWTDGYVEFIVLLEYVMFNVSA